MNIKKIRDVINSREAGILGNHKYYSVMVPIVELDGKLHILYEVRAAHISTQPNEVSFPGGKIERGEDPMQAALRETCEEIGISPNEIEVLGEGDRLIALADFTIYTYFGYIGESAYKNMKINGDEVGEVFLVPLKFFMDNEPDVRIFKIYQDIGDDFPFEDVNIEPTYKFFSSKVEVPIYRYEDKAIWGLTGRITRAFVQALKSENVAKV